MEIETTEGLAGRVASFEEESMNLVRLPVGSRKPQALQKLIDRAESLQVDLEKGVRQAGNAVRRAAILEQEGEGDEALETLVDLKRLVARHSGPRDYCRGLAASMDSRPWTAIGYLERVVISGKTAMASDALEVLAGELEKLGREDDHQCAQAAVYALPGTGQDLAAAEAELTAVIERNEGHLQAAYRIARLYEDKGEIATALELYISVLTSTQEVSDFYVRLAYDRLRRRLPRVAESKTLVELAQRLVLTASFHEADRLEILPAIFASPKLDDEAAAKLSASLIAELSKRKKSDVRGASEAEALRLSRISRLIAQVEICGCRELETADARAENEGIEKLTSQSRAISARVLHDLWRNRGNAILTGEIEFASSAARLAAYLRTLDREVRWLGEAVRAGSLRDAGTPIDIRDLLVLLAQMFSSVSDDPITASALASMVSSDELEKRITPIIEAFFRRLRNIDRTWDRLEDSSRLDATIHAACQAEGESDYARDELTTYVNQRLLAIGTKTERLRARLALAELFLDQRRFDMAVQEAEQALLIDPECGDAHYWLGMAHMRSGKRLLGLESLREASERFGQGRAFAAIGDDCAREEEPDFASRYFIKAVDCALRHQDQLESWEFNLISDWLRRAKGENDRVREFPVIIDKKLPRKEQKQKKKELDDKNAQRMAERESREAQMRELSKRLSWAKALTLRSTGR